MKNTVLRAVVAGAVAALGLAPGAGAPAPASGSAPIDLIAPAPVLEAAGDGSSVVPRIAGFGLSSRPGEPALPLRVLLVAIPEGSLPELLITGARSEAIEGLSIAPVPRPRVRDRQAIVRRGGADRLDREFSQDAGLYGRDAEFPALPVRLGRTGYLREQRYVEVLHTPVLYNPVRRSARFFPEVRAEVRFTIPDGALPAAAAFRADPLFEETYRAGLLNYEQGKLFRVPAGSAGGELTASATVALQPAAAGAPRYKIKVSRRGVVRLDAAYLGASAADLLASDPRTWMLTAEGVEVPISIRTAAGGSGEDDGRFDPGDILEFFGRPKTEPPTIMNYDFGTTFPDIYQANDFTDTQVYWITPTGSPGSHRRIPQAAGAPLAGFPLAADFEETAIWDENNIYLPLGAADPFFSIPSLLAGSTAASRDLSVPLPGLVRSGAAAGVTVRLRGGSGLAASPDHRTRAWANNDTASGIDFTWDDETIVEQSFSVSSNVLSDPTTVHLNAPGISGISLDRQYPDMVTIRYRRAFAASGDALAFGWPNQDARFQVSGFSGPPAAIYDVSRTIPGSAEADPVLITGAVVSGGATATYTFEVPRDAGAGAPALRAFFVAGPGGVRPPDGMTRAADPVLKDPANAADIIVIAARDTVDPAPGGALDNLLAHRLSAQGLTSRLVDVDQIYDEFSFGQRDANALRSFLAWAFDNWKGPAGSARPPAFALLVGDATPDYKNTLNRTDWVDQVPTAMMFQVSSILGYYSSDNLIASFRGADQVPDIHLGRISTRSAAESAGVFDKIRRYGESPAAGLWKGHAVLAAGEGKVAGEADQFEAVETGLATAYFSQAPFSVPSPPLYFDNAPWLATDAAGFRASLLNEINAGAAFLSFVGHGSFETWGLTTFFSAADARTLGNAPYLPFMLNVNCLAGGFHYLSGSGSLGEAMTNNPSGGAIASFAPSGLSSTFVGETIAGALVGPLFGPRRERLLSTAASEVRAALWGQGSITDLQSYTFLGDPATLLATPAPPPPTGLAAAAGNGEVTLSWTPPPEPVAGTRLYRATAAAGPYAAVACDPISASSCADRTVANATTYYYYAASFDAEGFAGRASNFNSDCGSAGPDCVMARPLNPGAPSAPAGLTSRDPGTGGRLDVSWTPNPENDLRLYTLYYGTLPGTYPFKVTVPSTTTAVTLSGLSDSLRYYMALTATNTSGNESARSAEISDVPHLVQGIAPPRAISDLMLARSGSDLLLTWSRPAVDIYERPTTVVGYRVYRGVTPDFQPFASTPIAVISDGAVTGYKDAGAAALASNVYYIVTAVDSAGLMSGAGRELPNGVSDLSVSVPAAGTLRLAWSAVATDMDGLPTLIDHYQVHVSSRPIPRGSIGPTTLLMDNVRALSVDLSTPAGPYFITVIAVDDRGNLSPF